MSEGQKLRDEGNIDEVANGLGQMQDPLAIPTLVLAVSDVSGEAVGERTFIMLKPDAVQRGLFGEFIDRFKSIRAGYPQVHAG